MSHTITSYQLVLFTDADAMNHVTDHLEDMEDQSDDDKARQFRGEGTWI
jgi:hypothetical protein